MRSVISKKRKKKKKKSSRCQGGRGGWKDFDAKGINDWKVSTLVIDFCPAVNSSEWDCRARLDSFSLIFNYFIWRIALGGQAAVNKEWFVYFLLEGGWNHVSISELTEKGIGMTTAYNHVIATQKFLTFGKLFRIWRASIGKVGGMMDQWYYKWTKEWMNE